MYRYRKKFLLFLPALSALALGWVGNNLHAETAVLQQEQLEADQLGESWVRLRSNDDGTPLALEVAIVRYTNPQFADRAPEKLREYVDLVGAIHIGDARYYAQLNRRFRQYDALLYELVAPEGTVIQKGRGTSNMHPLGAMQNGMKNMLAIEHQLEQIDYTRPNFVHADFSPEEFAESMKKRDEGWAKLYFRLLGQGIAQQSEQAAKGNSADVDILAALFSDDRPRRLKIALAKQFDTMEAMLAGLSGPDGSTLITERRLGVFYGAGHLTDMHKRLVDEFDLTPVNIEWLEAWNLRAK